MKRYSRVMAFLETDDAGGGCHWGARGGGFFGAFKGVDQNGGARMGEINLSYRPYRYLL